MSEKFHVYFTCILHTDLSENRVFRKRFVKNVLNPSAITGQDKDSRHFSGFYSTLFYQNVTEDCGSFLSVQILSSLKSPYSKHNRLPLQTGFDKTLMR